MGAYKNFAIESRDRMAAALESAQRAFDAGLEDLNGQRAVDRRDLEILQRLVSVFCIEGDPEVCQNYPIHCVDGHAHDPQYRACVCGHGLLYHGGGGAAGDDCRVVGSGGYHCDCGEYQRAIRAGVLAPH